MARSETAQNIKSKVGEGYNYVVGKIWGEEAQKKEQNLNNSNVDANINEIHSHNEDHGIDNQFTSKADFNKTENINEKK